MGGKGRNQGRESEAADKQESGKKVATSDFSQNSPLHNLIIPFPSRLPLPPPLLNHPPRPPAILSLGYPSYYNGGLLRCPWSLKDSHKG